MIVEGRIKMGAFFAGVLSGFSRFLGLQNSLKTVIFFAEEPNCPKEFL